MRIESIQEFKELFDTQRHRVERLREIARQQGDAEADALLRDAWLRLRQGPVRTLVMGVSSAGKSALINALVGKIVVPEGSYTTSPIPVWIYSDRFANEIPYTTIFQEENGEYVKGTTSQYGHITKYCYNPRQAGAGSGQREFEKVISAAVNVKSGVVSGTGITLIDTPGIGASLADNTRVQQILADGCELLIIVFRDLQDEDVKAYFRKLLLDADAPLGSLLEDSRVFMVLNSLRPHTAHAKMDAGIHIADAFDGQANQERLFVLNAQHARLTSCGIYPYPSLMPDGFNQEDRIQAEESMKAEQKELPKARVPEDLDRLRKALAQEAEYLCTEPEEASRIWDPIQEKIDAAIARLRAPLEEKRRQAEEMSYPAPPELLQEAEALDKMDQAINHWDSMAREILTSGLAYSQQHFSMDALMKKLRKHATMDANGLLTDNTAAAEQLLTQELAEGNGPESLTLLVKTRIRNYREPLLALLESDQQNPERKYWQKEFQRLDLPNFPCRDSTAVSQAADGFQRSVAEAYEVARAAAAQALLDSDCFRIAEEEQRSLLAYLQIQQQKIRAKGAAGVWNRFWLYANVKIDQLDPLLGQALRKGAESYTNTLRESFWSHSVMLYLQYHALLVQCAQTIKQQQMTVEKQIHEIQEQAKHAALAEIEQQLKELDVQHRKDAKL